jgi:hypothetical protein
VSLQSPLSQGGLLTEYEEKDRALREKQAEDIRKLRWREHEYLEQRAAEAAHSQAVADDADREAKERERQRRQDAETAAGEARAAELRLLRSRVEWIRGCIPGVPRLLSAEDAPAAIEAQCRKMAGEALLKQAEHELESRKRM